MVAFVAKRIGQGLLTLFVMSILIFAATNVLPGNVAETVLGKQATPALVASLDHKLGLNRSLVARYESWLTGAVHGDFGQSAVAVAENNLGNASVAKMIGVPLRNSAILAFLAMLVIMPTAVLLGVLAGSARRQQTGLRNLIPRARAGRVSRVRARDCVDRALLLHARLASARRARTAREHASQPPDSLILPLLTLVGVSVGWAARQVRAGMVEVMRRDYVMVARLAGIPERRVLRRYALRNGLATSVQVLAQTAQYLLGGIIVVEVLFSYPGVGSLLDSPFRLGTRPSCRPSR